MRYSDLIELSTAMKAHQSYKLCRTKVPGRMYLKLKGVDKDKVYKLLKVVEAAVGTNRTFSHNPANRTACFTLYGEAQCIGEVKRAQ